MDRWSTTGYIWAGKKKRHATYKVVRALIKDEPLILMFEDDEVAITNVFGVHLGYLTTKATAKAIVKHNEGYLLLAKVDRPIKSSKQRVGVYVWADENRLDSSDKELVDADLEAV